MKLDLKFKENNQRLDLKFGQYQDLTDGGYERGLAEGQEIGYAEALDKRTDLVVTENGEYPPPEDSTGFKRVSVNVRDVKFNQYVKGTLTEVTAEDFQGITQLREYSFRGVPSLKRVEFAEDLWNVGSNTFAACPKLETLDFSKCKKVRYLGHFSFQDCISLREVTIPSTVERFDTSVFQGCSSLSKVTFEENELFNTIGMNALRDCVSLTEIKIPNNVKTIGVHAFRNCTSLTEITIPSVVSSISSYGFADCTSLKLVKLKPKTPPSIQSKTFQNVPTDCVYMVDYGCGDVYRNATNWSAIANQIVEGDV